MANGSNTSGHGPRFADPRGGYLAVIALAAALIALALIARCGR